MKYESRAALLRAAADSIEMQEKAGIDPMCKFHLRGIGPISCAMFDDDTYEFPLAVVEGKPVFVGDKLYDTKGNQRTVKSHWQVLIDGKWSWSPPKPKTVMVELDVEVAKKLAEPKNYMFFNVTDIQSACRKALEAI